MRLRVQWLYTAVVLGCACSASAPGGGQKTRVEEVVTLEADGDLAFVLADAMGRVDSLDIAGKPVGGIGGCRRRYVEPEASTGEDAGKSSGYTVFEFDRSPKWPLQLRWRGERTDTVTVIVRCTLSDSACIASAAVPSAGGTRLSRVRIERKIQGKACALRIIRL